MTPLAVGCAVICALVGVLIGGLIGWLARGNSWAHRRDISRQTSLSRDLLAFQAQTVGDAVMPLLHPLNHTLHSLTEHMDTMERRRIRELSQLNESVVTMQRNSSKLSEEANKLSSALRSPNVRGRWGEIQLQRIAELSGMVQHCDFDTQHYMLSDQGAQRPDMVVMLAQERTIVVDAKVPFESYLSALNAEDEETATRYRGECAGAVRSHIDTLAKKAYWSAFQNAPEFVVLFVPSDAFLDTVLQTRPTLLDYAFGKKVVLATPTTLIALLRTVALTWQHDALTQDAQAIKELGQELYHRIGTISQHLSSVGDHLGKAVESYNSAVGSLNKRLAVAARRLSEHGISPSSPVAELETVRAEPRPSSDNS